MFDTYVTIVGNVLTAPAWRRTTQSNTLVANFKVASTARRLDRDSGRWVDGNSLRVRVNCWRKLAEGVAASVMVGDPVIVAGRLYTRDWTDDAGNHRTLYELEAVAVGHDLSRGRSRFLRNRPGATTSTVEDAEAESRVHGEATEPVPAGEAPASFDDRPFDDEVDGFAPPHAGHGLPGGDLPDRPGFDELADPFDDPAEGDPDSGGPDSDGLGGDGLDSGALDGPGLDDGGPGGDGLGGDREVVAGATGPGAAGADTVSGVTPTGRGRRGRGRAPVPA
ncbi:single-stranded DNA-binding protein [Micromonospora sp. R77]|uniref:single-stranded DNA-binding protein n=1 Tax=Micromonospora sp. R77 TaxID=2925836 RepID=UPI001F6102F8|nr:single-stranded DNA-binding protein [Micromonospora sp. R77]MCI4062276.1 single-stranded DNA-binding protein [Micromonospora sp. R77]